MDRFDITPEMIETGVAFLRASGRLTHEMPGDREFVADLLWTVLSAKTPKSTGKRQQGAAKEK